MNQKCSDCSEPVFTDEKQLKRWKDFVAKNPQMKMPRRCKECRDLRKQQQQ